MVGRGERVNEQRGQGAPSVLMVVKDLASFLEGKGVGYAVVGGVAVLAYGYARSTQDVDVIVEHEKLDVAAFCRHLRDRGMDAREEDLEAAFAEKGHATIFVSCCCGGLLRLDVKGVYSWADREAVETAKRIEACGVSFRVVGPELLICHKLLFGSPRDLEDALAVYVRMEPKLNLELLRRTAGKIGVEDRLAKLREMAGKAIKEQERWVAERSPR